MTKKEFISWITDLGFTKDWNNNVYYIFLGTTGKIYFSIEESNELEVDSLGMNGNFDIKIYSMSVISSYEPIHFVNPNLGHFPLSSIGEFEKDIILSILIKKFDEIPLSIKKYLRDSKIKSILEY